MPYLKVVDRFRLTVLCGIAWVVLSTWLAWPWIVELSHTVSMAGALVIVAGIALIPGYLNVQLVTSLLMDHPVPIDFDFDFPALTLLIAAYNAQGRIAETLSYALRQEYPASLRVIVIDDGSRDETVRLARRIAHEDRRLRVIEAPHRGKAHALNRGLCAVSTPLVATIDADTLLVKGALMRIVSRMLLARLHRRGHRDDMGAARPGRTHQL